jgi:hypothetical protein
MKLEQKIFDSAAAWRTRFSNLAGAVPQLVFVFGGRPLLENPGIYSDLRRLYPTASLVIASTSGEISGTEVSEDCLVATAVAFDKTQVRALATDVHAAAESYEVGRDLAGRLAGADLVHVFVVSDGQRVNGTELARGFNEKLPPGVSLTGGLAGDGVRFEKTVVGLDELPRVGRVVAVGFYGKDLRVGFGSSGGWVPFGPERVVTQAQGNTLRELDGQSALLLYRDYLGDCAAELPGSALRFPLCLTPAQGGPQVVRTILSVDDAAGTMVFAGDIPLGSRVRFMRASYEDLIDGAAHAAEESRLAPAPDLAICVSCVGRRIVLGQRTEEETEIVQETLGGSPLLAGFYSYGELAPSGGGSACQLHNQTMTITTLREE